MPIRSRAFTNARFKRLGWLPMEKRWTLNPPNRRGTDPMPGGVPICALGAQGMHGGDQSVRAWSYYSYVRFDPRRIRRPSLAAT